MNPEDRATLVALDEVLRSEKVLSLIRPIVQRVRGKLGTIGEAELMAWEPIPLETFGRGLPQGIRSGWIFILRAGADTGPERHPNSHQRMMTLEGNGDMRTKCEKEEKGIEWRSNFLISDPDAPLERRGISIPPNTWHLP